MFARPIILHASLLMVAAELHGQFSPTPIQAPPEALAALHVSSGTAQDLALPQNSVMPFQVRVHIAGAERTLSLQPRDACASDFQLLVHDASGVHPVPTPASVTFRGSVSDLPGAQVAASLIDGQLFATVHTGDGEIWGIEPLNEFIPSLPRAPHVVYRGSDVALPDGARCGAAHDFGKPEGHRVGPAALKVAEIAVDADFAYYNRYGANVVNVFNRVTTVMNSCNVIYGRDCEIEHLITAILVRTTNIYTWNGDLPNLFGQFRAYWNANHGAIRRDMAHLFTGEGTFSGVVGYAAISAVCNIANAYGSSKAYSNLALSTGLVSHEMGHNWGAGHCNNAPPCNIMCSTIGGCAGLGRFSPGEIATIVGFKNSRTCLSDPTRPTLVPAGNHNMEGHSAVALPFNNNNMILQQLMPPADVGLANGAVISSLTFLREGNFGNGNVDFNVQPFILDRVEIRLENTTTASLSTTAANNTHWTGGGVPTPRHVSSPLSVPGYTSPAATGPGGTNYVRFNLVPPLTYNSTQNLLLEVRNVATSQTDASPPAPGNIIDGSSSISFVAVRGYGCPNNAAQLPSYGNFVGGYALGMTTTGQILNPSTTVAAWVYWIGFQYQTVLGVVPGLGLNTFFSGTGVNCKFWVDPSLVLVGGGTMFPQPFSIGIPNAMVLLGAPLGTQTMFFDTNAPGGATLGPGLYAFIKTANPANACQVAVRTGPGNFASPAGDGLSLNSIPLQAYALTIRLN